MFTCQYYDIVIYEGINLLDAGCVAIHFMAYKLVIVRVLAISVSSAMELPKLKSVPSKYSSYTVNISQVEVVVVSFYLCGNHTL